MDEFARLRSDSRIPRAKTRTRVFAPLGGSEGALCWQALHHYIESDAFGAVYKECERLPKARPRLFPIAPASCAHGEFR